VEEARVARLAGLAKVWGAVKFFHPYLAYRDIDWDKALIETLPKVNAAKTPKEYETAVNQMLAVLNDKSTRATIEAETKPETPATQPTAPDAKLVHTENGVVVIDAAQIASAIVKDRTALNRVLTSINEALPKASLSTRAVQARRRYTHFILICSYARLFPQCLTQTSCLARRVTACTTVTQHRPVVVRVFTLQPLSPLHQTSSRETRKQRRRPSLSSSMKTHLP
jgi:hypothetical protein